MAYYPIQYPYNNPHYYENNPPFPGTRRQLRWVWPRDGMRDRNSFGRLKDILTCKGPDIFVSGYGHRPTRGRWSNRAWLDPYVQDISTKAPLWANRRDKAYNFRTRQYQREKVDGLQWGRPAVRDPWTWTDAGWDGTGNREPLYFRCAHGDFFQYYHDG